MIQLGLSLRLTSWVCQRDAEQLDASAETAKRAEEDTFNKGLGIGKNQK